MLLSLTACMPTIQPPSTKVAPQMLFDHYFIAADGVELPLRTWKARTNKPKAIIVALHGFNDYSHFFQEPAQYFSANNITAYAYDQRGFGETQYRGIWAGIDAYVNDLQQLTELIRKKHPATPVYWLGESMGGAVALVAASNKTTDVADGLILAAPAIWARDIMPWYQQTLLWSLSHTVPWLNLTGESMGVVASDNIEMLRALGRDPLVIKETRVDTVYGLANLMDAAAESATSINIPTLMLYGEKDDLIPFEPTFQFVNNFLSQKADNKMIACYENGYHMLLRDLQAEVLWKDITSWISSSKRFLPSAADKHTNCLDVALNTKPEEEEEKDADDTDESHSQKIEDKK
ncbi:MAG: alpha/beta fold hydrolase, partial [Methylococcaceae bacterium]|nr:alpha/beta fold hydrolase [Methylococcaceae bacterium]